MGWFFDKLLNLLYESSCLTCHATSTEFICNTCKDSFIIRSKNNYIKQFPKLKVYSWGVYEGKLREGIISLKNGKKKLSIYFGDILISFWQKLPEFNQCNYIVIPVPSHKSRIKERGYCQTSLIAKRFADKLNLLYSDKLVKRIKHTKHMNNLNNIFERQENVKEAFKASQIQSSRLLIIDDILTSGSTMCEVAKTIHETNPNIKITGLTIASGDTYNL